MSSKSNETQHYGQYIEYTGWYPLCRIARPDLDFLPAELTKDWKAVTCPECKATRSMMQMIICQCTHKEHGHKENIGECSRCDCPKFVERET